MTLKRVFILAFCCIYFVLGCTFSPETIESPSQDTMISAYKPGEKLYTAYNIWYEPGKENALWCINYKTGIRIPAGTAVRDVGLTMAVRGKKSGAAPLALSFVTVKDGRKYWVNFTEKFHPGKTINDYLEMMFTTKTFAQLTEGMNETELLGINNGVLIIGMSKKACIVSYGYPPEHRTPSLDMNVWVYWMNRLRTKEINFNSNNRAIAPPVIPGQL